MSSLDSTPSNTELFLEKAVELDSIQRRNVLLLAVKELLNRFVDLSFTRNLQSTPDKTVKHEYVQEYAKEVLSLLTQSKRGMGRELYVAGECSS